MPNNNVAILSIMSKFDEKSARQAAERANKVYDEALSDIGNVNFDKKLLENFDKAMNLLKNKFKKVNLSSYTNNLLDSIFSDKDIKEKSKDIELFISKIEMLKKASSGQDINAFNTFSAKQIDALISRTEKLAQKQEEINEKTREYNREATKIAKANRSISTIDKNFGNQDYSKTLESLKKSLGTEKEFTAEQNQSIENLAKMVNLYQIMEKSEPQKGTAEAIRYSKDLLAVTQKIKEERDKIDAFSQKGASTYIANNGLSSVDKVNDYTVNKSKEDFVKASLSNLKSQEAKLQSELTTYISESVQKNLAKVSKEVDAVVDKAEKRVENLQNKIESLQTKSTKTDSDNSIIGGIVSNSDIKSLEEIEDRLYAISDLDAEGEATKQQLKEYIQLYKQYEQLIANDSTVKFDPGLKEEYDFIVESDSKLKKYADTLDETISKQKELNAVKSNENEVFVDAQTEQLVKQEEQIKETIQAEKQLQDTQEKVSSNTKISVDAEQAIADINKIKESLNSIPEEKNIKITISDSDYTNTPLLSDAEGNTITAFRGVVGAWSGLINQDGIGFFTDKLKLAADYADSLAESGKVYQANLSFKNPLEVESNGAKWDEIDFNGVKKTTDEIVELAKQLGHDGVIFKNIRDGFTDTDEDISNVMVALNAAQIKNEQVIGTVKAGTGEMVDVASKIDNATDTATNSTVESQNKIQEELKETQKVAEQVSEAISKVNTNNVSFTQKNSELDAKISDVEKLNNSVKELISNSGDYKVGEIVDWDDTKKLLSTVQELDNYDVLKSLGLSEGAIQEEEGKIKEFVQTIKYQYDEFVNAWNKQDDDDIFSWSDSIGSNLNELNSYIDSLISSYKQLNDISSVSDKSNISSRNSIIEDQNKIQEEIKETRESLHLLSDEYGNLIYANRGVNHTIGAGLNSNRYHGGTFWTISKELAANYGSKIEVANLSMNKPFEIDNKGYNWDEIELYYNQLEELKKYVEKIKSKTEEIQIAISNIADPEEDFKLPTFDIDNEGNILSFGENSIEYIDSIEKLRDALWGCVDLGDPKIQQSITNLYDCLQTYARMNQLLNKGELNTNEVVEIAKNLGYDGVIFKNIMDGSDEVTDIFVTLEQNQVHYVETLDNIAIKEELAKSKAEKIANSRKELYNNLKNLSDSDLNTIVSDFQIGVVPNIWEEFLSTQDFNDSFDNIKANLLKYVSDLKSEFSENLSKIDSPIKDVFQGEDNSNTSFSSNLDEIEKEKSALLELKNTVSLITEEIDRKTQAFHNEKSAVDLIIPEEIATLESLERELKIIIKSIEQISKIPINIDFNLENLDENSANAISKLKDSLSGFNGSSLTNISSILEGFKISKANVENLQKLSNAILTLKSNLNNVGNSGQQFLSDIKELVAQSDGLKDLATVLKSSQKQIDNAKKTTNANVDSKNTEENTNAWKELTYSIQRYSEVSKRISSGKALEGDIEEASRLENKISQLQKLDILSPTQAEKSEQMLTKLYDSLDDIEKKSKETTLESLNLSIDKYRNDFNSRSSKPFTDNQSDQYKKLLANYETSIAKLETYRDKISNNPLVSKEDLNQIDKLTKKVKESSTAFNSLTASQKGSTPLSRGKAIEWANDLLEQNSKWSKKAKIEVQGWINKLASADPSNVEEIRNRILEVVRAEREAGNAGKTWLDIFSTKKLHSFLGQAASMFSFYDLISLGRKGFQTIRELDTALTEMKKVSDETTQSLKNYQSTTFDVGDAVGATAKTIQNSTADWMRLGESIDEAAESAKVSNILLNVSEFESIDEATKSLVSMSQAYQELEKIDIVDKINNIGNNFSISTDELARGMQNAAAVLKTQGNDIDKAISLITAGNAITQNAEKTSAGIRTIALRIAGTEEAKDELQEMGEDVDDFVVKTSSKTQQIIKDYTAVASNAYKGIDVLDANGNLRDTYDILLDIARIYKEIQEEDKKAGTNRAQALVEELAGKNRSNIASSILLNPQLLEDVYKTSQNSSGSAQNELNAYLDSIEGKMTQLENRAQEFWYKVIDSDTIKNGITLLTNLLEIGTKLVDTFGLLPSIVTIFGGIQGFKKLDYASV